MKALLCTTIFAIYISHVLCQVGPKINVKSYPKKVKPYGTGKILINSKYDYSKIKSSSSVPTKKLYTAFQEVGPKFIQGVPDSPYFPVDQGLEHKTRGKKVLPEVSWSLGRSKRSAVLNASTDDKNDKKTESTAGKLESKLPETTTKLTKRAKLDEEKTTATTTRKSISTIDNKTNNIKKGTENTAQISTKSETKIETTTHKDVGGSTGTKSSKKPMDDTITTNGKIESKSTKKDEPKTLKLVDARSNKTSQAETKTKTSVAIAKRKLKDEETSTKSKVKENKPVTSNVQQNSKDTKSNVQILRTKVNAKDIRTKKKNKKSVTGQRIVKKIDKKLKRKVAKKKGKDAKKSKKLPKNAARKENKPKANRRLIAAREALIEDYPYVVSIQKNNEHWCTGALLNPRLVITTANCVWKSRQVSRMQVRAGSRHTNRGGQLVGIQEVMKHPGWGLRKNPDNDVALLLLNRNLRFSDDCHSVDIPNKIMQPPFDDAWVVSWGTERRDGVYDMDSTTLQVYHSRLIPRPKCNNVTMRFSVIVSENFICLSQGGKSAPCTRDTGAPAVSDGIVWGLASWGLRKLCGTERYPAMFSYLGSRSNLDFITNSTLYLMSDKRYYPFPDRYPNVHSSREGRK